MSRDLIRIRKDYLDRIANRNFVAASELIPDEVPFDLRWKSCVHLALRQDRAALRVAHQLLEKNDSDVFAMRQMGMIHAGSHESDCRNGRVAKSLSIRSASLSQLPSFREFALLGAAHAELGEFELAVESSRRAAELADEPFDVLMTAQTTKYENAIRFLIDYELYQAIVSGAFFKCSECGQSALLRINDQHHKCVVCASPDELE